MSWTDCVACSSCLAMPRQWRVVDGQWTCQCGAPMREVAIRAARKVYRLPDNQGLPTR